MREMKRSVVMGKGYAIWMQIRDVEKSQSLKGSA